MDRHCNVVGDGDVAAAAAADGGDGADVKLVHRGPNDPELKNDRFVSDSYDSDSSDCYGSLYVDYGVVLDAAIDGTVDMLRYVVVVDEVQHPRPSMELSFVERIQEHPLRACGQLQR